MKIETNYVIIPSPFPPYFPYCAYSKVLAFAERSRFGPSNSNIAYIINHQLGNSNAETSILSSFL